MATSDDLIVSMLNPYTGIKEDMFYDDNDQKIVVARTSDVTKMIEGNKRLQNETSTLPRRTAPTYERVARIDFNTLERIKQEYNIDWNHPDDLPRLLKWLEHPDNKFFKTTTKRLA